MFGKLVKNEFKATYKLFVLITVIMVLITIVGVLILNSPFLLRGNFKDVITVSSVMIYSMALTFAVMIGTLYVVIRYYKNVFGREGYLTNTLPVTTGQILNSKLLVATIWLTFITVILLASILVLLFTTGEVYNVKVFDIITDVVCDKRYIGIVISLILLLIISIAEKCTSYYFCCAIGQLSNQHKVLFSILTFVVLSFVTGVITNIFSVSMATFSEDAFDLIMNNGIFKIFLENTDYMTGVVTGAVVLINMMNAGLIALGAVFYVFSYRIMKKRLNLE